MAKQIPSDVLPTCSNGSKDYASFLTPDRASMLEGNSLRTQTVHHGVLCDDESTQQTPQRLSLRALIYVFLIILLLQVGYHSFNAFSNKHANSHRKVEANCSGFSPQWLYTFDYNLPYPTLTSLVFHSYGLEGQKQASSIEFFEDPEESDILRVHVSASYSKWHPIGWNNVQVCRIENLEAKEIGVDIRVNKWHLPWHPTKAKFQIYVYLPTKSLNTSTFSSFHSLQADLQNFNIACYKSIACQHINITTTNGLVRAHYFRHDGGLAAKTINIRNTDGHIMGRFNWTNSDAVRSPMSLRTTNGHLVVDVGVMVDNPHEGREPAEVILETSNSFMNLDATFRLLSSKDVESAAEAPSYNISVTRNDGPITLNFASQPPFSSLNLSASTSHGSAKVALHPAFEGTFALHSPGNDKDGTDHKVKARFDVWKRDPSGLGRGRSASFYPSSEEDEEVTGEVSWWSPPSRKDEDEKLRGNGRVDVRASYAPVTSNL